MSNKQIQCLKSITEFNAKDFGCLQMFYKLIFPKYYCCPLGLKKHSFADETCSAGFYPGDPFCNDENNNAECNYDNGACCDHWTLVGYSWTLWDYFCTVRNHLISILF